MRLIAILLGLMLGIAFPIASQAAEVAGGKTDAITNIRWLPLTEIEKNALDNKAGKLHDLPLWFTPYNTLRPRVTERFQIFSDRNVYLADDPVGQFLMVFTGADTSDPSSKLTVELVTDAKEKS